MYNYNFPDSSLEPIPYATQDGDLLVRMDLDSSVMIPGVTKIRLRTIPESSDREPLDFPVDDVFFEGSRFYAFVPASRLKFRQFHVQVALVVDGEIGPFSPAEVTESQYVGKDPSQTHRHHQSSPFLFLSFLHTIIDYDDEGSDKMLLYIVPPVCATAVVVIIVIGVLLATTYLIYDRRHACDSILRFIKSELREQVRSGTFNRKVFDDFKGMMQQMIDVKKSICGFKETKNTWTCCCYQAVPQMQQRRGAANEGEGGEGGGDRVMGEGKEGEEEEHVARAPSVQGQLGDDGSGITAEQGRQLCVRVLNPIRTALVLFIHAGRKLILELIDDIEQELKCRKFSRQTTPHHA